MIFEKNMFFVTQFYNSGFDGGFGFFGTEEELSLACEQRVWVIGWFFG